ncbi:hypothetical protein D3C80_1739190 [compost metagenome]
MTVVVPFFPFGQLIDRRGSIGYGVKGISDAVAAADIRSECFLECRITNTGRTIGVQHG